MVRMMFVGESEVWVRCNVRCGGSAMGSEKGSEECTICTCSSVKGSRRVYRVRCRWEGVGIAVGGCHKSG